MPYSYDVLSNKVNHFASIRFHFSGEETIDPQISAGFGFDVIGKLRTYTLPDAYTIKGVYDIMVQPIGYIILFFLKISCYLYC